MSYFLILFVDKTDTKHMFKPPLVGKLRFNNMKVFIFHKKNTDNSRSHGNNDVIT